MAPVGVALGDGETVETGVLGAEGDGCRAAESKMDLQLEALALSIRAGL